MTKTTQGRHPARHFFAALSSSAPVRFFLERESRVRTHAALRRSESIRLQTARALLVRKRSPFFRPIDLLRHALFMTELRAFSALLLPLGLSAVFRCLIFPLLTDDFPLLPMDGIAGAVALLLSFFLLPFREPMCRTVTNDGFLSRLFFNSLSLPRPYPTGAHGIPAWLLLLPGLGLGAASLFLSPLLLLVAFFGLVFLILSLASPEFSLILSGILIPFLPLLPQSDILLLLAVCPGVLSYLFKLLFSKREFQFRPLDLFVLLFSLCFLLFALRAEPGNGLLRTGATLSLLSLAAYFLAANLLTARRTLHLFTGAILTVATVLSILGIYRSLTQLIAPSWLTHPTAVLADGAINTVLGEGYSLAAILLLTLPLIFVRARAGKLARWRAIPPILLFLTATVLTWQTAALLSLCGALLFFALLRSHSSVRFFPLLAFFTAFTLFLLPEAAHTALTEALGLFGEATAEGAEALFAAWRRTRDGLFAHPLGLPPEEIGEVHALPLGIALRFGLPGILLFSCLVLYAMRTALASHTLAEENPFRLSALAASASVFGLLLFGFTAPVLEHGSTLYLFFLLLGILAASVRGARIEALAILSGKAGKEASTATAEVRLHRSRAQEGP